jgi:hypothetical protein
MAQSGPCEGSIQGSNLHETEGNSDHLKPHRNAKTVVDRTRVT